MDSEDTKSGHRRRSSSLVHAAGSNTRPKRISPSQRHRRTRSDGILEEDKSSDEGESGSSQSMSEDYEMDDIPDNGLEDDEETGLTSKDRKKRRRRKRRNTLLDERVAGDVKYTKEEEKIAKQILFKDLAINAILIGLWYLFSISISIYNKWMFSNNKHDDNSGTKPDENPSSNTSDNLNFPFPLFTTCVHMIVQFSLASLVLFFVPSLRPRHDSTDPHHHSQVPARTEPADTSKPLMTKWFYFTRIGPCGAATGLDIGLGNMSLKFISLTFFTMCKSSVLGFVLLFAFLFRLEKPSWKLGGIILTMTIGVVMMVGGETAFNALGFILVMSAAFFSGFRWSLTQILLLRNPATSNPFSSIFFLAPIMFLSLLVIALPVEGVNQLHAGFATLAQVKGTGTAVLILLFPGVLAFLMTASEFALLKRTNVVTLSICGIFKEVLTISAASIRFHDKLTPINISGLLVTLASIAAYNYMKIRKMRDEARRDAHLQVEDYAPVLSSEPPGEGEGVFKGEEEQGRRAGTQILIRNSLSIPAGGSLERQAVVESPVRTSPVKRPEDLD